MVPVVAVIDAVTANDDDDMDEDWTMYTTAKTSVHPGDPMPTPPPRPGDVPKTKKRPHAAVASGAGDYFSSGSCILTCYCTVYKHVYTV